MGKVDDIYKSSEWTQRRAQCQAYRNEYDGRALDVADPRRDRSTGKKVRRYPLGIKLVQLACDVHSQLARGIPKYDMSLVVRSSVERRDDSEHAQHLDDVLNDRVWVPSHGATIQQEALLAMNIYGGVGFKVHWDPTNLMLPLGVAVHLIDNPAYLFPVFDYADRWTLLECYVGYEIDPRVAEIKYGVKVESGLAEKAIYLEHWTPETYEITVNDKVAKGPDGIPLRGENRWGFVPIVYIPHERTSSSLLGRSQTDGQGDLELEVNSVAARVADLIHAARPGIFFATDLTRDPKVRRVHDSGDEVLTVIDGGRTRGGQNAQPPKLAAIPTANVPTNLIEYPRVLLDFWMMVARVSPAVFGLDDTASGRITGSAVANRMFTSMAHAVTERINFTAGKTAVDRMILRMLAVSLGDIAKTHPQAAGLSVSEQDARSVIRQSWPPMLPMDRKEHHEEWTERLKEGGVGPRTYLRETGIEDVERELEDIYAHLKKTADIEADATVKATAARFAIGQGQDDRDQGNNRQGNGAPQGRRPISA